MAKTTTNAYGLTDQQVRFCHEYAKNLNATQAYKAAGYQCKTDTVARASSSQLLAKPSIRAYLGEILNLSEVSVINAVAAIGLTDITEVVAWDREGVEPIPSDRLSVRAKGAIKSIKCKRKTTTRTIGDVQEVDVTTEWEITMHDKLGALEKLMKKLSLYPKEDLTEMDVVTKLAEMNVVPYWLIDSATKVLTKTREDFETLLHSQMPEPSEYQSSPSDRDEGISEKTAARIRAQIMGIEPSSENGFN
jgi:phage terminase small subunit